MNIRKILSAILLLASVTSAYTGPANNLTDEQTSIFDITSTVKLSIETDVEHLILNREIMQIPARILVTTDNAERSFNASVEVRGNFRRDASNCDFPPLRLRFDDNDIKGTLFDGNPNIKIVTHCKENSRKFIEYMGREYTTYKLYNLLNPYSLKVKMVEITYIDDKDHLEPMSNQAFLIEDISHLATRHNMKEIEGTFSEADIDKDNLLQVSVFQFMIGNTDWIIPFSKNLKFIQDDKRILLVPYDFDYTALVASDYSRENGQSVLAAPVRMYKGPCLEAAEFEKEFDRLKRKEEDLIALISSSLYLKPKSKSDMIEYLHEFYSIIGKPGKFKKYFQEKCN